MSKYQARIPTTLGALLLALPRDCRAYAVTEALCQVYVAHPREATRLKAQAGRMLRTIRAEVERIIGNPQVSLSLGDRLAVAVQDYLDAVVTVPTTYRPTEWAATEPLSRVAGTIEAIRFYVEEQRQRKRVNAGGLSTASWGSD